MTSSMPKETLNNDGSGGGGEFWDPGMRSLSKWQGNGVFFVVGHVSKSFGTTMKAESSRTLTS